MLYSKQRSIAGDLVIVVPVARLELARGFPLRILSPVCLPIPVFSSKKSTDREYSVRDDLKTYHPLDRSRLRIPVEDELRQKRLVRRRFFRHLQIRSDKVRTSRGQFQLTNNRPSNIKISLRLSIPVLHYDKCGNCHFESVFLASSESPSCCHHPISHSRQDLKAASFSP